MESKQLILVIVLTILLISIVGAETYKQDTDINIAHSVRLNGAPISDAICNITIENPNALTLVQFAPMVYTASTEQYNYTLDSKNTSVLGIYKYDITCLHTTENSTERFTFEVTPTGKEYTTAQSITYFFLFLLAIGFFILTLYGALVIPFKNKIGPYGEIIAVDFKKYLKMFLIVMCYGFLILLSFLGWNISYGFLSFITVGYFFRVIFIGLMAFAPVLILGIITFSFLNLVQDKKTQKLLDSGFGLQEAMK